MAEALPKALQTCVQQGRNGTWLLRIWAQPGAKKTEITGLYEDRLRVRIQAPAVDNKANKALLLFIAKKLCLKHSQITLTAGESSRQKTCSIEADNPVWQNIIPE